MLTTVGEIGLSFYLEVAVVDAAVLHRRVLLLCSKMKDSDAIATTNDATWSKGRSSQLELLLLSLLLLLVRPDKPEKQLDRQQLKVVK